MKTVKVRIAVAVNRDGTWTAFGESSMNDEACIDEAEWNADSGHGIVWIEADAPVPEPVTVQGTVMLDKPE